MVLHYQWLQNQADALLMNPLSLSIFIVLLIFSAALFLLRSQNSSSSSHSHSLNLPPCPPTLPLIGNLHQLSRLVHHSLRDLSRQHGPFMLMYLGWAKVLVVSSAEMAREIMKNHDNVFADRAITSTAKALMYGCKDIGLAPYGEYWRQVRKLCVLDLLCLKRVQSFKFIREEEAWSLVEKISRSSASSTGSTTIDLSDLLGILANNVVARCTFGSKYEGEDGRNRFEELSKTTMNLIREFSMADFFPCLGWMDILTGFRRRLKRHIQDIDTFLDEVIDEHMMKSELHGDLDQHHFLIDRLILAQKRKTLDVNLDRENIKAIIMDMFIGGTDTTATTLEWAMAELIKSPNAMKKVQGEVRGVVGEKMKVEEDDIQRMDYLKCVIKETLRLHAPVPTLLPREAITSATVNGYYIPAKTKVFINAWAIQRDPEVWERAEEFVPERFLCSGGIDFKCQDFDFIPFGSGRRSCPGVAFGLSFVEVALASLLYWFDWELPNGAIKEELDMTEVHRTTVSKRDPLLLVPTLHSF
ncbi:hypothetical protein Scep_017969 [Stephania cephalantha]|uniref:Cytochrome P450 n=1 Tax=Stephania cephalantha TaxID=152367 RepID=A0AAP0NXF5_9MAGN